MIYKTNTDEWFPGNYRRGFDNFDSLRVLDDVNDEDKILVIVVGREMPLTWGKIKNTFEWNWDLHIVFWDAEQRLLFIHSSNTNSYYKELAQAGCVYLTGMMSLEKTVDGSLNI